MRNLPIKLNPRQVIFVEATKDYFGPGAPVKGLQRNITNIALWLAGRRRDIRLNDEEKSALWYITQNLSDKTYCNTFNFKFDRGSSEGDKI